MSAVAHIDQYKTGLFFSDEYRGDMSWNGYENNVLLRNEGTDEAGIPRFTDVAMATGSDDVGDSRGVAVFDLDHDGDLDIAINHNSGDTGRPEPVIPALLRNDLGSRRSWLAVELEGRQSNRDGIGAEVRVRAGSETLLRVAQAGSGYASQHSRRLHFGLGGATEVESLEIRWPSGQVDRYGPYEAGRLIRAVEGEGAETLDLPQLASPPESASGP